MEQIETFRRRFSCYPESVHVDKIYRTRANRAFCKLHGIRMSGPPLGRKPQSVSAADKKQALADEAIRNGDKSASPTYNDFRILLGIERKVAGGLSRRVEVGYVFGRELEYKKTFPSPCLVA